MIGSIFQNRYNMYSSMNMSLICKYQRICVEMCEYATHIMGNDFQIENIWNIARMFRKLADLFLR